MFCVGHQGDEPWMSPVLGDAIVNFSMAKNFLDSKGIQVHNVGIDSKLEIFPKRISKAYLFNS